jgi:thiamine-monophosphate kinase
MSREQAFIARLARAATHPAARGLADDAAVLAVGDRALVLTHDMIVEGVHYLSDDPPEDVAWKLVAVNLSDLAAKGARPLGLLLGYPLAPDEGWDRRFADGIAAAAARWNAPLLGGDTVSVPAGAARQLGLTAIGEAPPGGAPSREGARAGDLLHVTGAIGGAGLGLAAALAGDTGSAWLARYRRPEPRLAEGRALAAQVSAMADVSDGLLIDAARMAAARGLGLEIALDRVPLPPGAPDGLAAVLAAATAGDDYELLCASPSPLAIREPGRATVTPVGRFRPGEGLTLTWGTVRVPVPERLGFLHGARQCPSPDDPAFRSALRIAGGDAVAPSDRLTR